MFQGEYIGCDHAFRSEWKQEINIYPKMSSVSPWHFRSMPSIEWSEMSHSSYYYTVLIVDVGFGDLFYLAYNFPSATKVNQSSNFYWRQTCTNFCILIL